ncbi:putative TonB-dependent receptor [Neisseria meningitidis]|nr:putative TonB-dependent receptor [Neisseria meningitidis]
MKISFHLALLPTLIIASFPVAAADTQDNGEHYTATLPTVSVVGQSDTSVLKGYINYDEAAVTRNGQLIKETPQTIDTLNIQKNKNYGTNDLSSILEGNAGIDAAYDMRGESIFLRGFQADASDIYRDGVRESGQVRRSTANIERVEILKGPSSVLYGRTNGGGVINMVSKYANFKQSRNIGTVYGSWANRSLNMDINEVLNKNVAIRLTGEVGRANSFRSGIDSKNVMVSPSITVKLDNGLKWTGQYTYDNVERTPDRSPTKSVYDRFGLPYRMGFAHRNDFVKDKLQVWRSDLEYAFNDKWRAQWQLAHRTAAQDFDHFYAGSENGNLIKRNYAWQQTDNKTLSSNLTLNGDYTIGRFENHLTVGMDYSREHRNPTLGFSSAFSASINPYDRASWPASGRLQPILTQNRHKADSYGIFVQNIFSATPDLKFVLGGRYDKYTFNSENKLTGSSRQYSGHSFSPQHRRSVEHQSRPHTLRLV